MAIGLAILGAGVFAREEHVPATKGNPKLSLKAIYSRTQASAEALAREHGCEYYFDSLSGSSSSLEALLDRTDIHAVIVALPINAQPEYIRKAIAAGKHVLSEKPIAKDVRIAHDLISWYQSQATKAIWAVAENFRFVNFVARTAEEAKSMGGRVVGFSMALHTLVDEDNKFFNTAWRKTPEYQGGFLLDGGVHFVAGLRALLAAVGEEVDTVACFSSLLRPMLAPVDTLHSIWHLKSGQSGTFVCSFGTEYKAGLTLELVTDRGSVLASPTKVTIKKKTVNGELSDTVLDMATGSGVGPELEAFADSITKGEIDPRQTPYEALADLKILEAMLRSGEEGGALVRLS